MFFFYSKGVTYLSTFIFAIISDGKLGRVKTVHIGKISSQTYMYIENVFLQVLFYIYWAMYY